MMYALMDLESTGNGKKDEVIQFSCMLTDTKFNPQKFYSFYCYTSVRSHPDAFQVHGISHDILIERSGMLTFEDNLFRMNEVLNQKDLVWISYGIDFDTRIINQTLVNNRMPMINFGERIRKLGGAKGVKKFCAMTGIANLQNKGINSKLRSAVLSIPGMTEEKINSLYEKMCEALGQPSISSFHDASYDTFCLWILMKHYGGMLI